MARTCKLYTVPGVRSGTSTERVLVLSTVTGAGLAVPVPV
jgi:hypothetical protein